VTDETVCNMLTLLQKGKSKVYCDWITFS